MKALWLEDRTLRFRDDVPVPEPAEGEALVRVLAAGICNTDLEMLRGYSRFTGILGHEFVGLVEQGPAELQGLRVVGEINISCGSCPVCRRGHSTHCENRTVLGIRGKHGAFAEYLTLPTDMLHPVPAEISTEAATFVEPLAAALRIHQQVSIAPDSRVLVVGAGKLGRLVIQALSLKGCVPQVASRRSQKISFTGCGDIFVKTTDEIDEGSAEVAIDCTGTPEGFAIARRALCPRGQLVLKSTYTGSLDLDASRLVVDEITVIGSRCGPFPEALDLLRSQRIEVLPLIGARFRLDQGLQAMDEARRPGALKVLLETGDNSE